MQYTEIIIKVTESISEFVDIWMYRKKTFFSLISMLPLADLWDVFWEAWEDQRTLECCPCPMLEEIYNAGSWTGRLVHGLSFHIYVGKITEDSWRRSDSTLSFLLKNRKSMFWFSWVKLFRKTSTNTEKGKHVACNDMKNLIISLLMHLENLGILLNVDLYLFISCSIYSTACREAAGLWKLSFSPLLFILMLHSGPAFIVWLPPLSSVSSLQSSLVFLQ